MSSQDRSDPGPKVAAHHASGTALARIPYPICIRTLEVLRSERVTPNMLRLTLGGPELEGMHTHQADDHVKIVLPDEDGTLRIPVANDEQMLDWPEPFPTTRSYTIRRYADGELDLDFVLHEGGVASTWVLDVKRGDRVAIAGPPGAKSFPHNYDHYVFAVDATALPAAARWLEESPADTRAHLVVETDDPAEHAYPLPERPGVEVVWLTRDKEAGSSLADTVRALPERPGTFLFAAGEADDIRPLRAWAKGRCDALFTGYWKRGVAGLDE